MKDAFKFKSLAEFMEYFRDEQTCREHFEKIRFAKGEYCPHCKHTEIYRFSDGKRFRCRKCKQDFTILTKTVFGESKIPLKKWFIAIYLLSTSSKGISSVQLAEKVGCTQKTGWFIDHRLREAMKQNNGQLFGTVEVDELYVGGLEKNKHASKRKHAGTGGTGKTPVIGMKSRAGEVQARIVSEPNARELQNQVATSVAVGSRVITDSYRAYNGLDLMFTHKVVSHSRGIYVDGDAHTNGIESFWALFKRGYHGVYHWMSPKHMQRYLDESAFRFNRRALSPLKKFSDTVSRVTESQHLGYKELTGKL